MIIDYETGHVKFFSLGYKADIDNLPLEKQIGEPLPIENKLRSDPEVKGVTSRVIFRATLSNGLDELPAVGIGVDLSHEDEVFRLKNAVSSGSYLTGGEGEMLLGADLAKDFDVKAGDTLTLLTRTKYDTYQALDLVVKGAIRTDDYQIDPSV
jgi:ABC-type lipoprotein release transport system permease subunit